MDYRRICSLLDLRLTPSQEWACAWLELDGLRFCVDFGTQNAERLAAERWTWWFPTQARQSRLVH